MESGKVMVQEGKPHELTLKYAKESVCPGFLYHLQFAQIFGLSGIFADEAPNDLEFFIYIEINGDLNLRLEYLFAKTSRWFRGCRYHNFWVELQNHLLI